MLELHKIPKLWIGMNCLTSTIHTHYSITPTISKQHLSLFTITKALSFRIASVSKQKQTTTTTKKKSTCKISPRTKSKHCVLLHLLTTNPILVWVLYVFPLFFPSTGNSIFPYTICNLSIPFFNYLRIRGALIRQSTYITEPDLLNICCENLNDPIIF